MREKKNLAGNRDNHMEGFKGFPIILKDSNDEKSGNPKSHVFGNDASSEVTYY